jgi:hypothetical protein
MAGWDFGGEVLERWSNSVTKGAQVLADALSCDASFTGNGL